CREVEQGDERLLAELLLDHRQVADRERGSALARSREPRDQRRLALLGAAPPDRARDRPDRVERGRSWAGGLARRGGRERPRRERGHRLLFMALAEEAQPVGPPGDDVRVLVGERPEEPWSGGGAADAREGPGGGAAHGDVATLLIGRRHQGRRAPVF